MERKPLKLKINSNDCIVVDWLWNMMRKICHDQEIVPVKLVYEILVPIIDLNKTVSQCAQVIEIVARYYIEIYK